jgi:hypothetical protein
MFMPLCTETPSLSITTLSLLKVSIKCLFMTLSIMTVRVKGLFVTLSIKGLFVTLGIMTFRHPVE